jgi:two-component system chemotaxis response regulator CheY
MNILIIDDSRLLKIMIKDYLNNLGHEAYMAENGLEGLAAAEKFKPDIILLDYNMPVMDGPTFLKNYIGNKISQAKVIMMTTESSMEIMKEVIGLGASEYIIKPFDEQVLKEKIERVVNL